MALSSEQRKVLAHILQGAKRAGASPKEVKAAVETGLVEANLGNPSSGDADSQGWRQERASLYKDPRNLDASIARFFQETRAVKGKYGTAGALAAAVQRPAAQYRGRYQQRSGEAEQLLRGSSSPAGFASRPAAVRGMQPQSAQTSTDPDAAKRVAFANYLLRTNPESMLLRLGVVDPNEPTTVTTPATRVASSSSQPQAPTARGGRLTPTARAGKVIGTPHTGTHTLGNWQSDNAVDIAVPIGTPMLALQDGTIVKVRRHPQGAGRFAGDQITIRGANGNEYFYAHGVAHVKAGQRVRKGQSLGTTGSANGVAHLHFGQERGDPREHT